MRYTVFCPCHDERPIIDIGDGPDVVELGDVMTCAHCECPHRVADVEANAHVGAVRLAPLNNDELREDGIELVIVACPRCATENRAGDRSGQTLDDRHAGIVFCSACRHPMIIEGDPDVGYTARELNDLERRALLRVALQQMGSTAQRLDALFPDAPPAGL